MCKAAAGDGELDRAGELAEPAGRVPDGLAAGLRPDGLAVGCPLGDLLDGAWLGGLDRGVDGRLEAPVAVAVAGGWVDVAGAVPGPNVATDSMAPATRHTARMLASSGMTVPVPPNGAVSFCRRVRRRRARCSRR